MKMTLKQLRKQKKLTQVECAKYLGIPVRTYQNYETDESKSTSMKYEFMIQKLEKYGFVKENKSQYVLTSRKSIMPSEERHIRRKIAMKVYIKSRKLFITQNVTCEYDNKIELLYDLIKADLVEKVEE